MIVVGISALFHDSACAVTIDGVPVAVAHEERFTRRRYDRSMPINAFRACLADAGISIGDIYYVAYFEDPTAKLARQLWMGLPCAATSTWPEFEWTAGGWPRRHNEGLVQLDAARPHREIWELLGYAGPIAAASHHESHAASAFYCTPARS